MLEQIAGPKNAAPPQGARTALLRGLAEAGLRVVGTDPRSALSRLHAEVQRTREQRRDEADGDLDDELGEAAA